MAAVVTVKKELRKKIKAILKDVSDASAATQSMCVPFENLMPAIDVSSYPCHQRIASHARVQGSSADKHLSFHAHRRNQHLKYCA